MTELASFATGCIVTQDWKSLCIGKVMPFFEVKVVDLSSGQLLGAGEIGEICVRSPTTMIGYADNSAATSSMIDAEELKTSSSLSHLSRYSRLNWRICCYNTHMWLRLW
ncbi:hypothetical protein O3P69_012190 [Scylla paramamosain]|uniref:AMP-dependent synthetase/ligase domain-containing protein n=1 Tax=Scylla paramamosain TaxID=85552 RepID=A0AAW0TDH8_SCYPA